MSEWYKDERMVRNPDWSTRVNQIMSWIDAAQEKAEDMIDPNRHYSGLQDPFWRTSTGRDTMAKWAEGNQSLEEIYEQMSRIDSGSRNDLAVSNARAEAQNLRNGYAPTVAAFKRGELSHILDSNGNVLPTVGYKVGSPIYNALLKDLNSSNDPSRSSVRRSEPTTSNAPAPIATTFPTKDMATIAGGPNGGQPTFPNDFDYGAGRGAPPPIATTFPTKDMATIAGGPNGGQPTFPNDYDYSRGTGSPPPIATTFPTKDMATIVGGPNAGQPTFPNDFDYGAQQGAPGSAAKPLPMEEVAMLRGLFGGSQRGIERSGTWGSGHTQRISGSELQRMAQDAWQSVKPHAESWAQSNPDMYNRLKQTADSFRENPGMFGKTTEDMRNALRVALEKKLLG